MVANEFDVERAANQRFERAVRRLATRSFWDVELCVSQVSNTRREDEPEQPHEREDVVSKSRRIGVVLGDTQVRLMVQKAVKNIRGVANTDVDHLGAERRVLIGDMRVKSSTGFGAVLGVDARCFPPCHPRETVDRLMRR